jgi:hypothetical protein
LEERLLRLENPPVPPMATNPLGSAWGAAASGLSAATTQPGGTLNNPAVVNQGGNGSTFASAAPCTVVTDRLTQEMSQMKLLMDGLRSEMNSERVHCGGVAFTSPQLTTNWAVKQGVEDKMELFLDLVSLSSLSFLLLSSDMDELRFDETQQSAATRGLPTRPSMNCRFERNFPQFLGQLRRMVSLETRALFQRSQHSPIGIHSWA